MVSVCVRARVLDLCGTVVFECENVIVLCAVTLNIVVWHVFAVVRVCLQTVLQYKVCVWLLYYVVLCLVCECYYCFGKKLFTLTYVLLMFSFLVVLFITPNSVPWLPQKRKSNKPPKTKSARKLTKDKNKTEKFYLVTMPCKKECHTALSASLQNQNNTTHFWVCTKVWPAMTQIQAKKTSKMSHKKSKEAGNFQLWT